MLLIKTVPKNVRLSQRDASEQNLSATDTSECVQNDFAQSFSGAALVQKRSLHSRACEALSLSRAAPSVVGSDKVPLSSEGSVGFHYCPWTALAHEGSQGLQCEAQSG